MPRFSYGAKQPTVHFTAWKWNQHPAATLPRPSSFDAYAGPMAILLENEADEDQNGWNGCVGFETARSVRYAIVRAGMDDPGQLSPWWAWDATKAMENGGDDSQNIGTDPHDALTIARNEGIPPIDAYNAEQAQRLGMFESSRFGQGIEFYYCQTLDQLLDGMGTLRVPGNITIAVYNDFETPLPDETLADPTGNVLGYHNLELRRYDDSKLNGRFRNQWKGWTSDNEATVSYTQLRAMYAGGYIVTHPHVAAPADAFWSYWGSAGDYAVANHSVDKLSEQSRVLGQWLPYLLRV